MHQVEGFFVPRVGACLSIAINRPIAPPGYAGGLYPPVIEPMHMKALIDMGTQGSCVHSNALRFLDIEARSKTTVSNPFIDGFLECALWEISVNIPTVESKTLVFDRVLVIESPSTQPEIGMILGRDFLRRVVMTYDGPEQRCTLMIRDEIKDRPRGCWPAPHAEWLPLWSGNAKALAR